MTTSHHTSSREVAKAKYRGQFHTAEPKARSEIEALIVDATLDPTRADTWPRYNALRPRLTGDEARSLHALLTARACAATRRSELR